MHLQRILWRAVGDFAEAEPATWRQVVMASLDRKGPGSSLRQLLRPVISHLQKSNSASHAETATGSPQEKT
jgi:hypothetical protein